MLSGGGGRLRGDERETARGRARASERERERERAPVEHSVSESGGVGVAHAPAAPRAATAAQNIQSAKSSQGVSITLSYRNASVASSVPERIYIIPLAFASSSSVWTLERWPVLGKKRDVRSLTCTRTERGEGSRIEYVELDEDEDVGLEISNVKEKGKKEKKKRKKRGGKRKKQETRKKRIY